MASKTLRNRCRRSAFGAMPEVCQIDGEGFGMNEDQKEAFEERAAIIEYCTGAGMTRREAEQIAAEQMGLEDEDEFLMGSRDG